MSVAGTSPGRGPGLPQDDVRLRADGNTDAAGAAFGQVVGDLHP